MSADLTWKDLEHRFRELQAEMTADCLLAWYTRTCWDDGATEEQWDYHGGDVRSRKRFQSLASAGARKLGFAENANADGGWLARVQEYLGAKITPTGTRTEYGRTATTEGVRINRVAEASADYCLRLIGRGTPESAVGLQSQARNSDTPAFSAHHNPIKRLYENAERWDTNVPPELIPAVKHLRKSFERVHFIFGWPTENVCYWLLHKSPINEDVERHAKKLGKLKAIIGPIAARRHDDLIAVSTPPAIFKALYDFYLEGVSVQTLYVFKQLVEIGRAHEQRLAVPHLKWATDQTKHLIRSEKHKIMTWVRSVCDKHGILPGKGIQFEEWQAPRLLIMKPSGFEPYAATRLWERTDRETSSRWLESLQDDYVRLLEMRLESAAGFAAVELAKQPLSPTDSPSERGNPGSVSIATSNSGAKSASSERLSVSEDFHSIVFNGTPYSLTQAQSQMMKLLWNAHQKGHPAVGKMTLLSALERETSQVRDTWRSSGLWNTLIVSKKKGTYQLDLPPQ